jgi:hypothetical protein
MLDVALNEHARDRFRGLRPTSWVLELDLQTGFVHAANGPSREGHGPSRKVQDPQHNLAVPAIDEVGAPAAEAFD